MCGCPYCRAIRDLPGMAPTPVRVVLLCHEFGETFARAASERPDKLHLLRRGAAGDYHVAKGLLEVGGTPAVHYWLTALEHCARLMPLEESVYLLCNDTNRADFVEWARGPKGGKGVVGLSEERIISTGPGGKPGLQCVAELVREEGLDCHLFIIDCEHILGPQASVVRLLEHAMIRAKNTIVTCPARAGQDVGDYGLLDLEHAGGAAGTNPRVRACEPLVEGEAEGGENLALPLVVLRKSSLPLLLEFPAGLEQPRNSLQQLVAAMARSGACYAICTETVFSLATFESYEQADKFFGYYFRKKKKLLEKTKKTSSRRPDSNIGAVIRGDQQIDRQLDAMEKELLSRKEGGGGGGEGENEVLKLFSDFMEISGGAVQASKGPRPIPARFKNAQGWKHQPLKQHAVFQTSNNVYGAKKPSQQEMPLKWNGIRGEFTKTFGGGRYRDTSFNTSKTTSRVVNMKEDF